MRLNLVCLLVGLAALVMLAGPTAVQAAPNLVVNGNFACAHGSACNPFCHWVGCCGGKCPQFSEEILCETNATVHGSRLTSPLRLSACASATGTADITGMSSRLIENLIVNQTIHGLPCDQPVTVHFQVCCPACVTTTLCVSGTPITGHECDYVQAEDLIRVCFGGHCGVEEFFCARGFDGCFLQHGGIGDLCYCITPQRCCSCGLFTACKSCPNLLQGNLRFLESICVDGFINNAGGTAGDSYTASTTIDPFLSITVKGAAGAAPELDPETERLPAALVLATLCVVVDRRRRSSAIVRRPL